MKEIRSNFTLARCCANCHYYQGQWPAQGTCTLPKITDPKASLVKTHITCVCDAHTWVKNRRRVQRPAINAGATLPDDVI